MHSYTRIHTHTHSTQKHVHTHTRAPTEARERMDRRWWQYFETEDVAKSWEHLLLKAAGDEDKFCDWSLAWAVGCCYFNCYDCHRVWRQDDVRPPAIHGSLVFPHSPPNCCSNSTSAVLWKQCACLSFFNQAPVLAFRASILLFVAALTGNWKLNDAQVNVKICDNSFNCGHNDKRKNVYWYLKK